MLPWVIDVKRGKVVKADDAGEDIKPTSVESKNMDATSDISSEATLPAQPETVLGKLQRKHDKKVNSKLFKHAKAKAKAEKKSKVKSKELKR